MHKQVSKKLHKQEDDEAKCNELGCNCHQNLPGLMWKTCLVIESESSVDIFNNAERLTGVN